MSSHQLIVDSLPCAAAVLDFKGTFRLGNQPWRRLMGERSRPDDPLAARLLEHLVQESWGQPTDTQVVHRIGEAWVQSRITWLAALGDAAVLTHEPVADLQSVQNQLRAALDAITVPTGRELLRAITRQAAVMLGGRHAFLGVPKRTVNGRVRTLVRVDAGEFVDNFEYDLRGTPCEPVLNHHACIHPHGVADRFPTAKWLRDNRIEAYLGVPLTSADGTSLGFLAVMSETPFTRPIDTQLLAVLAMRAGTEVMRMRAERTARDSEERLHLAIDATADGTFDWDLVTGEVRGNERLFSMLGYHRQQLRTGTDWNDLVHPDDLDQTLTAIRNHLRGETPLYRAEIRMRGADGAWKWILDRGKVVQRSPDGKALRMAGLHSDISDRKRLELQLQVAERLASVGALAASLAHEVNTPLSYLTAGLDALASGATSADALNMAREGAERIREVVRDVKTFSHVDPDAPRSASDVMEPLKRALRLSRLEVSLKARLQEELQPMPYVECNPAQLAHVFLNLVMNAAQAVPHDSSSQVVLVRCRTGQDGWAEIEVQDSGPGIPPEVAPHIFEPFFTTRPPGEGSGLGLAICRAVVSAHGGALSFDTRPGLTLFRVRLPPAPHPANRASVPELAVAAPPPEETPGPRRRVLVVDDHPAMGTSLKLMLNEEHDVDTVTDADAALQKLGATSYDVILCDLMMPGVSGMDLYRMVERDQPAVARRFVFMTGGAATSSAARFLEQTRLRVLEKPFRPEALRSVLMAPVA